MLEDIVEEKPDNDNKKRNSDSSNANILHNTSTILGSFSDYLSVDQDSPNSARHIEKAKLS